MQEIQGTQVQFMRWEGSLKEEIATYSTILARIIIWTEEPGGLQPMGWQRVGHNWETEDTLHLHYLELLSSNQESEVQQLVKTSRNIQFYDWTVENMTI